MKKFLTILILLSSILVAAQSNDVLPEIPEKNNEEKIKENILPKGFDVSFTLQNLHFWRGVSVTDVIFSSIDVTYAFDVKREFILGIWGGSSLASETDVKNTWHEVDYYVKYENKRLLLGFWDCYNDSYAEPPKHNIWNYDSKSTAHRVDLRGNWIVSDKIPVRLEFGTSLYGNDRDSKGNNRYSTYLEMGYPFYKKNKLIIDGFCGFGMGLTGESHMYGNGKNNFDVVNVGLKVSRILDFLSYKIPITITPMWNPSKQISRVKLEVVIF